MLLDLRVWGFAHPLQKVYSKSYAGHIKVKLNFDYSYLPDDRLDVDRRLPASELVAHPEVDMVPGDRGYLQDLGSACRIADAHPVFPESGEEGGIVKNDAVADQPGALVPDLLLVLCLKRSLPKFAWETALRSWW